MACSLSLTPLASIACWRGRGAGRTIHYRIQTGLAGCEIAPIPPDAAAPIRYLTIRVWLAGMESESIN